MNLSGKELAGKIGCARSTLSEASKKGHLVDGRYDVQSWANFGPRGRVEGYDVPEEVPFLSDPSRENPEDLVGAAPDEGDSVAWSGDSDPSIDAGEPDLGLSAMSRLLAERKETTRKVAEESGDRTQFVSDKTDVEGTVRNAGFAYTAGKAIEHDTPGARAFWTVAGALTGGIGGYAMTDENPWGALLGAIGLGSVGYLTYGQQPRRQEGSPDRRRGQRSGQDGSQNGDPAGGRTRAVSLNTR